MIQARVFVSCGQREGTGEIEIAHRVAEKLEKMGFEPYIAVEERTLKGVKENIFRRLGESEYLVFVDFKRERLFEPKNQSFTDTGNHRGSLFSHQELAIAAFLDIESLVFREKTVKEDDGILKFIQANSIPFTDRHLLPDAIAEKIRERKWNPNWRNEILLERDEKEFEDVRYIGGKERPTRFYHVNVRNLHQREIAHDCVAYIERVEDISTGTERALELVELKWKGVISDRVAIPPSKSRDLDAFYIHYDRPDMVHLSVNPFIVDYSGYYERYTLIGPGSFELVFVVFSENFPPARATFALRVGDKVEEVEFSMRKSNHQSGLATFI